MSCSKSGILAHKIGFGVSLLFYSMGHISICLFRFQHYHRSLATGLFHKEG